MATMTIEELIMLEQRDPVYARELQVGIKANKPLLTREEQIAIAKSDDWIEQSELANRKDLCEEVQWMLLDTGDYRILRNLITSTTILAVWQKCREHNCCNVKDAAVVHPTFGWRAQLPEL